MQATTPRIVVSTATLEHLAVAMELLKADLAKRSPAPRPRIARGTTPPPVVRVKVGDKSPTPVLADAVRALIKERAMTLADLVIATGARRNRISGVLAKMGDKRNLGDGRRALWYLGR